MNTKLIFSANVARKLIKKGYRVIDIKPNRENPDKTVFVFNVVEGFLNELELLEK